MSRIKRHHVKAAFFVALAAVCTWFGSQGLVIAEDPIAALKDKEPIRHAIFSLFFDKGPFKGKLFVETTALSPVEIEDLDATMAREGYHLAPGGTAAVDPSPQASADLVKLAALLPERDLRARLADAELDRRVDQARSAAALPGGTAFLHEMEIDPFMLRPLVATAVLPAPTGSGNQTRIRVYLSPAVTSFPAIGRAYEKLQTFGDRIHYIGGDLFAYENYRAVKSDITFCILVSIPLNLLLFFLFVRSWVFLVFFIFGSFLSYATGLVAVRAFYSEVYSLVLAFTSTFVGFNNEYLVHLSGLDKSHAKRTLVSLGSAIGTTLIGFLVLIGSSSAIIRQMALISLGAMGGFLVFLLAYQPVLAKIKLRTFRWPSFSFGKGPLLAIWAVLGVTIAIFGIPAAKTHIETFKFAAPRLDTEVVYFRDKMPSIDLDEIYAVPAGADPYSTWRGLSKNAAGAHPLRFFREETAQAPTLAAYDSLAATQIDRLSAKLAQAGFTLDLASVPRRLAPVTSRQYLSLIGPFSPIPWLATVEHQEFLFATTSAAPSGSIPVSPKKYYDTLLTGLGKEMGMLFLVGMIVMVVFLVPLQRGFWPVLYIFSPLAACATILFIACALTGATLNVVHFMGAALVIAVALDYTAIAISTDWAPEEMNKILLTGASTLASFGVLAFAKHPLLRDLGLIVAGGTGLSLFFTLFLRFVPATSSVAAAAKSVSNRERTVP